MQTIQNPNPNSVGFQPIPTRIRDVAPLIVNPETTNPAVREEVIANLTSLTSNLATVHRTTAEAYLSEGIYDQAVSHLEVAVKFEPDNVEYWNQLGYVAYLSDNDDLAIHAFQAVISRDSNQTDALYNLGMVLFSKGQYPQAENCFNAYLELAPDDSQGWNNRGVCLHQTSRTDEARQCFHRALQLNPSDADAQFNLQNL